MFELFNFLSFKLRFHLFTFCINYIQAIYVYTFSEFLLKRIRAPTSLANHIASFIMFRLSSRYFT